MSYQARQGDLLIERAKRLPRGASPREGLVLAQGEATGHAHRLEHGQLYVKAAELYFTTPVDVVLRHEEHGPILLTPGIYRVRRQREYTPEAPRMVAD